MSFSIFVFTLSSLCFFKQFKYLNIAIFSRKKIFLTYFPRLQFPTLLQKKIFIKRLNLYSQIYATRKVFEFNCIFFYSCRSHNYMFFIINQLALFVIYSVFTKLLLFFYNVAGVVIHIIHKIIKPFGATTISQNSKDLLEMGTNQTGESALLFVRASSSRDSDKQAPFAKSNKCVSE